MTPTYRGGQVGYCGECSSPVVVFRYEDPDAGWAQLFEYTCGGCGHHERDEDWQGDDIVEGYTPFYSSTEKGMADCRCPGCGATYTATLADTVEWEGNSVPTRRFETLRGTCPSCGLGFDARRDGMDLGYESGTDERNVHELER